MKIDLKTLAEDTRQTPSDLANQILYDLCQAYPCHDADEAIYAKILLIGRSHAAAIERRRQPKKAKKLPNDEFYEKKVVPTIRTNPVDQWIKEAEATPGLNPDSLPILLSVHAKVMRLFQGISGSNQRSLASKYLHFHLPNHFFLYDSRAVQALGFLKDVIGKRFVVAKNARHDTEYERLVRKCLKLQAEALKLGVPLLTPRHVDNLLLKVHAEEMKRRERQGCRSRKRGK
jgi:hypothetical protein